MRQEFLDKIAKIEEVYGHWKNHKDLIILPSMILSLKMRMMS